MFHSHTTFFVNINTCLSYLKRGKDTLHNCSCLWFLHCRDNSWKWSDGTNPRRDANFSKVVPVSLMPQGISEYCFLVTNETKLEVENCTESHAFACDLTNGKVQLMISTSSLYFIKCPWVAYIRDITEA